MREKLRIAILAPASLPVPSFEGYGGTQRGIYDFITHMSEKGHEIYLFAPKDSKVSHLKNVFLHGFFNSLWVPENNLSLEEKLLQTEIHKEKSIETLREINREYPFDIINLRIDYLDSIKRITQEFGAEKIVYGLHNTKDQARIDVIKELGIRCVAHCRNHKLEHENLPNIRVIVYGINVEQFPFSRNTLSTTEESPTLEPLKKLKEKNQDYLINIGNIGEHKGQETCIRLTRDTGNNLILAGTPQCRTDMKKKRYLEERVLPYVDGEQIIYFGNANEEQKKELLKYAKGFLFPSGYEDNGWKEPFGRAPVEALSCGTPVIAYRSGSMEEIIYDSFNGFLFENYDQATKQIGLLDKISREDCRRTAEIKFNSKRVADEYEDLFYEMKEEAKKIKNYVL